MTLAARAEGAYDVRAWGPLGLALVALLALAAARGLGVDRSVAAAAAALVALGLSAVASTAWGGLPQQAWYALDRSLLAAAALLVGNALAAGGRRGLVQAGVLAGVAAQCVEILARTASGAAPEAWFYGRALEGPVGYHNAQGLLCAVALPLALRAACGSDPRRRAAGAMATAPLLSVLLLTQSRGALAAAIVAVGCQLALSRRLRLVVVAAALAAGGGVLAVALRAVDRTLSTAGPAAATDQLRTYALVALVVAALVGAVAALPGPRRRLELRPRTLVGAAVAVLAACAIAGAAAAPALQPELRTLATGLLSDAPPDAAPGATRFASISLDGRREAWRVATGAIGDSPLLGLGVGRYAERWAVERRLPELYVLQPHSLELELVSELGATAIALFVAFAAAAFLVVRGALRVDRPTAAAAGAALVALVVEASVDWTWSFPGIVAPVLLVVGAVGRSVPGGRIRLALLPAAAVALVAFALPYLAADRVARAADAGTPSAALADVRAARLLDPWNADAISAEARALEAQGRFVDAAARYGEAARLAQRPWLDWFRRARALRRAGADDAPIVEACLLAQRANPAEVALHRAPCGWPWLALRVPGTRPPGPEGVTRRSLSRP